MPESAPPKPQRIAIVLTLLVTAIAVYFATRRESPPDRPPLADLGRIPDWSRLQTYDGVLSRAQFERELTEVFTIGDTWRDYLTISDSSVMIAVRNDEPISIAFAAEEPGKSPPRYWRPAEELPVVPSDKPLTGLHIALDPGHIGGDYAKLEARWFQIGDAHPVMEGEMVLKVAQLLAPQLRELGAKVSLVRESTQPVTPKRKEDFEAFARKQLREGSPSEIAALSERLFYRTAEIRERARIINEELKPDLVVCLHFNAEAWGDPANPTLTAVNHFHVLINGAYTPGEVDHDDERFEMLNRLLQGMHRTEAEMASVMAEAFVDITALPPYLYDPNSGRALNIDGNPFVWARNLLANRLYQCPVLFLEPYVMNSHEVHARIQAGDYQGLKEINGQPQPSIYREYAEAVSSGLTEYYRRYRKLDRSQDTGSGSPE